MHCYVTLSNVHILSSAYKDVYSVCNQKPAGQLNIRYVIVLFVFNTVCYGYLIFVKMKFSWIS